MECLGVAGCRLRTGVVSPRFPEQFDELKWFEQQPSGTEDHRFGGLFGTTEVLP
jgi:hypothetical protein